MPVQEQAAIVADKAVLDSAGADAVEDGKLAVGVVEDVVELEVVFAELQLIGVDPVDGGGGWRLEPHHDLY